MTGIQGYDAWKTASPDEDYDDTACYHCGVTLEEGEGDDYAADGFCSKQCYDENAAGETAPPCARPLYDLLNESLAGADVPYDIAKQAWSVMIFMNTGCGAWITVDQETIRIGSIVEGSDAGTETQVLKWPFSKEKLWEVITEVDEEALEIFGEGNG